MSNRRGSKPLMAEMIVFMIFRAEFLTMAMKSGPFVVLK